MTRIFGFPPFPVLSDLESPVLHIPHVFRVVEVAAIETFGVGISRVGVGCVLRRVADETFVVSEGHP